MANNACNTLTSQRRKEHNLHATLPAKLMTGISPSAKSSSDFPVTHIVDAVQKEPFLLGFTKLKQTTISLVPLRRRSGLHVPTMNSFRQMIRCANYYRCLPASYTRFKKGSGVLVALVVSYD